LTLCAVVCVLSNPSQAQAGAAQPAPPAQRIPVQQPVQQSARDTRTWYQAYADAQRNIQQRNWQAALSDLDAAQRLGAPRPGRNVNFYGDVYRDYNPDYYRGLALMNLQRFDEADQSFERVRQANLITQRDALFAQFNRDAAAVKDIMQKMAVAPAPPTATPPPSTTPSTSPPVTAGVEPPVGSGVNTGVLPPTAMPAPNYNPPSGGTQIPGGLSPDDRSAKANLPSARRQPPSPYVPATVGGKSPPPQPEPPQRQTGDERTAILRDFAGDDGGAAALLTQLAASPAASPRIFFYLACSRTALALTGGAAQDVIAEARSQLARAGSPAQFQRDLAFISPRVQRQLGLTP
jgi:hypothetical protein